MGINDLCCNYPTLLLCFAKAATGSTWTGSCGCISVQSYLQSPVLGQFGPGTVFVNPASEFLQVTSHCYLFWVLRVDTICAISFLQVRNQLREGQGSAHNHAGKRWQPRPSPRFSSPVTTVHHLLHRRRTDPTQEKSILFFHSDHQEHGIDQFSIWCFFCIMQTEPLC